MNKKSYNKDFTKGNIYIHLFALSFPLIIGNILQQLYNTIDAFVVGHFAGPKEFAAIGISGTVMNLFLFVIVGECSGFSILFSHFYGLKDRDMLHLQHFTSLSLGLISSIIMSILGILSLKYILLFINTPDSLYHYTSVYLWWIFISLPASFLYNMYASALRSSGDTIAALIILAIAVAFNLFLDIVFVSYMNMGICGAAMATAFTQLLSAALCICYLFYFHKEFMFSLKECKLGRTIITTTLKISFVTAIHQAGLYVGKVLIQGIVNSGGENIISAYTASTRIEGFANSFGDSISSSTSILVSHNNSSGNYKRVNETFLCSVKSTFLLGIVCTFILFFTSNITVGLLLDAQNTSAFNYGRNYLLIISVFYLFCFLGNSFTGYFNGTENVIITLAGSITQITIRVVFSFLLFKTFKLNAVAISTGIGWIIANIFWLLNWKFNGKLHLTKKKIE